MRHERPAIFEAIYERDADQLIRQIESNPKLLKTTFELDSRNGALSGPKTTINSKAPSPDRPFRFSKRVLPVKNPGFFEPKMPRESIYFLFQVTFEVAKELKHHIFSCFQTANKSTEK